MECFTCRRLATGAFYMTLDRALRWFAAGWCGVVAALYALGLLWLALTEPTLWSWSWSAEELADPAKRFLFRTVADPMNVWNWWPAIVALLPALVAEVWREKRRNRQKSLR